MQRSQYVRTYLLGGSSRVSSAKGCYGRQGESNCTLQSHRRLSGCQTDTGAKEKRIASLSGFHHSVHAGQWSGRCLLAQPCVDAVLLKAGGRYSWPLCRQTRRLLCRAREVSRWGTLSQSCKANCGWFALRYGCLWVDISSVSTRKLYELHGDKTCIEIKHHANLSFSF